MAPERLYHCTITHRDATMHTVALYREDATTCDVQSPTDGSVWYTLPIAYVVLGARVQVPDARIEAEKSDAEWAYRKGEGWTCLRRNGC